MEKWADYGISAVRLNRAGTHINAVLAHPDKGKTFGEGKELTRQQVVEMLKRGTTFTTIIKSSDDTWRKGEYVHIMPLTLEFIKTDADDEIRDNLDNLPKF